jgi:serine-type D-Ala-D-Ala carboxypeptidase/endopeptidase (penicillin-binding protein 4)
MKNILLLIALFFSKIVFCQTVTIALDAAIKKLEQDAQFKHAILSMYVVDSKTGKEVFDKNSNYGLAPASCQKVITSASAFELLGNAYKYKTEIYSMESYPFNDTTYEIGIVGYGDPTIGSWRYESNKPEMFLKSIGVAVKKIKIDSALDIFIDDTKWGTQTIPNGWIWEDIGNYYGAGASSFNWNENQYDIVLLSGKFIGDKVAVLQKPFGKFFKITNELKTAAEGSGDNAYIYFDGNKNSIFLRGTIPLSKKPMTITGAIYNGADLFWEYAQTKKINDKLTFFSLSYKSQEKHYHVREERVFEKLLYTHLSPTLDSINYWFLKKSINLYGEAFVKTIGYEKKGVGATDTGLNIIKYFWKQRGVEPSAINIIDGSGLSPANRVTTNALVTVMQYSKKQKWFTSFYNALPEMNGIKMKDGYISGVRSYTGYVKSKSGNEYTFALIVNNFDGSPVTVREKMWKVLDVLK